MVIRVHASLVLVTPRQKAEQGKEQFPDAVLPVVPAAY
jgi:hypothetical protein